MDTKATTSSWDCSKRGLKLTTELTTGVSNYPADFELLSEAAICKNKDPREDLSLMLRRYNKILDWRRQPLSVMPFNELPGLILNFYLLQIARVRNLEHINHWGMLQALPACLTSGDWVQEQENPSSWKFISLFSLCQQQKGDGYWKGSVIRK